MLESWNFFSLDLEEDFVFQELFVSLCIFSGSVAVPNSCDHFFDVGLKWKIVMMGQRRRLVRNQLIVLDECMMAEKFTGEPES